MSQIDLTFYEHIILLLDAMSISLREKQCYVTYIKMFKKSVQCNNQCSLHFNTLWTYVSALIVKHAYLPTHCHQSVWNFCLFHCGVSVWLCPWSNAEIVFCILALEWKTIFQKPTFSTTECDLKSNAITVAMDLVIRFTPSEFGWCRATAWSIFLWLASATGRCFSPNSGWYRARWFLKLVV